MRAGGYIPEVFTGGIEYKEVLMNDGVPVSSFFGLSDTEQSAGGADFVDIHLIFFVDLAVLKPTLAHRGDEEVRLDVAKAAQFNPYGFKLVSTTAGLSGIISEYPGVGDGLNFRDMHPLHCFRLNFQTQYNPLQ